MKTNLSVLLACLLFQFFLIPTSEAIVTVVSSKIQSGQEITRNPAVSLRSAELTPADKRALRKEIRQQRRAARKEKVLEKAALSAIIGAGAGLVLAFVSPLLAVTVGMAAVALGIIALVRINRDSENRRGRWLAWLGIVLGLVPLAFIITVLVLFIG